MKKKYWSLLKEDEKSGNELTNKFVQNYLDKKQLSKSDSYKITFETPDKLCQYFLKDILDINTLITKINNYYDLLIGLENDGFKIKYFAKWYLEILLDHEIFQDIDEEDDIKFDFKDFPKYIPPTSPYVILYLTKVIIEKDPSILNKYNNLMDRSSNDLEDKDSYIIKLNDKINDPKNCLDFVKNVIQHDTKLEGLNKAIKRTSDEASLIIEDNNYLKNSVEDLFLKLLEYKDLEKSQYELLIRYKNLYRSLSLPIN